VNQLFHLPTGEKSLLKNALMGCPDLFKGGLGVLKVSPAHLERTMPNAKPHRAKPFPVPCACEQTSWKETNKLTRIGTIESLNKALAALGGICVC
jgi:hypothetical protein